MRTKVKKKRPPPQTNIYIRTNAKKNGEPHKRMAMILYGVLTVISDMKKRC